MSLRRPVRAISLGVLAVCALLLTGCSTPEAPALDRKTAPPNVTIDPAQPCTREEDGGAAEGEEAAAQVRSIPNGVEVTGGKNVTLADIAGRSGGNLKKAGDGIWELRGDLVVSGGASVRIAAPEVRWLKLISDGDRIATLQPATGGTLEIAGSCITTWDVSTATADTNQENGRGYLLARDGGILNIDKAELRFLGSGQVQSYGLSWRTEGTTGKITNSLVSHNYFGLYSYGVDGLVVTDNEFHDNTLYGIDPHTESHNMTIERNVAHDNGKHGIILAEDCTDSVIRDNIVYRNAHHGIVLYLRSDRNTIEGNHAFANAAEGININESNDSVVRNNYVYDNQESGISIAQTSSNIVVENNQMRANGKDGVRVVSESQQTTVRNNNIGENGRYGVYVDVDGDLSIAGNMIFANKTGIMMRGSSVVPESDNTIFNNAERPIINDN